jgi:hypothetical protein
MFAGSSYPQLWRTFQHIVFMFMEAEVTHSLVQYTLHAPLSAVKIFAEPTEDPEQHPVLSPIPDGSTVEFEGDIVLSGMVTILWQGSRFQRLLG